MKYLQGKRKVYLSLFLIKHYAVKIYILNLCIRRSFTPQNYSSA